MKLWKQGVFAGLVALSLLTAPVFAEEARREAAGNSERQADQGHNLRRLFHKFLEDKGVSDPSALTEEQLARYWAAFRESLADEQKSVLDDIRGIYLRKFDTNGDGKVDREEYNAQKEAIDHFLERVANYQENHADSTADEDAAVRRRAHENGIDDPDLIRRDVQGGEESNAENSAENGGDTARRGDAARGEDAQRGGDSPRRGGDAPKRGGDRR